MTLPDASAIPFEKEQSVLAIKPNIQDIEERFVKFQDPSFLTTQLGYAKEAAKKMSYLKSENQYEPETFLREPGMTELYNFNKHSFSWKGGNYKISIEMQSPEKFDLVDNIREFNLTPLDIEKMEKNKELLELDYKRIAIGGDEKVDWQWCRPVLVKTLTMLSYCLNL